MYDRVGRTRGTERFPLQGHPTILDRLKAINSAHEAAAAGANQPIDAHDFAGRRLQTDAREPVARDSASLEDYLGTVDGPRRSYRHTVQGRVFARKLAPCADNRLDDFFAAKLSSFASEHDGAVRKPHDAVGNGIDFVKFVVDQ